MRALLQQSNLKHLTALALPLAHAVAAVNNVQLVQQLLHLGANHMLHTNKGARGCSSTVVNDVTYVVGMCA